MSGAVVLGLILAFVLFNIDTALILERRRRKGDPSSSTRPYKWGYYIGVVAIMFGTIMLFVGIADERDGSWVAGVALFAVYATLGYFVTRRRAWAWVLLTIASLNPILWVAHYAYGENRWSEFAAEKALRSSLGEQGLTVESRLSKRIRRWHGGKLVLVWFGGAVLLLFLNAVLEQTGSDRATVLVIWLVLISPIIWASWIWFDGREER